MKKLAQSVPAVLILKLIGGMHYNLEFQAAVNVKENDTAKQLASNNVNTKLANRILNTP